jgi:hypothetical protein
MPLLELAAVSLSGTLAKFLCRSWLGGDGIATAMSESALDLLSGRLSDQFQERRTARFLDEAMEILGKKCRPWPRGVSLTCPTTRRPPA